MSSFQDEHQSKDKIFGAFRGVILRSQLIVLLKHKVNVNFNELFCFKNYI